MVEQIGFPSNDNSESSGHSEIHQISSHLTFKVQNQYWVTNHKHYSEMNVQKTGHTSLKNLSYDQWTMDRDGQY